MGNYTIPTINKLKYTEEYTYWQSSALYLL